MTIISYAANHEDVLLWRALRQQEAGFYVDAGAAEPDASVTRLFYEAGWSGIDIAPTPDRAAHLRAARRRDVIIEAALGAAAGRTVVQSAGSAAIEVEVLPLSAIVQRHAPASIHFLRIAAAGGEEAVLAGADLNACRPWVILIEASGSPGAAGHDRWEPLLVAAGYGFVWCDGRNRFYVAAERMGALRAAFTAPSNARDDFITSAEHDLRSRLAGADAAMAIRLRDAECRASDAKARATGLAAQLAEQQAGAAELARQLKRATRQIRKIKRSTAWRMAAPLRAGERVVRRCLSVFGRSRRARLVAADAASATGDECYRLWIAENEQKKSVPPKGRTHPGAAPSLAFLLEDDGKDPGGLGRTLASLAAQTDGAWTCLVAAVTPAGATDRRIRSLSPTAEQPGASLNALVAATPADFIAVLDAGDVLAPGAVAAVRAVLAAEPLLDLIYSDEDVIGADGARRDPACKPGWSPELLLAYNYIGRLAVLRRSLVEAAGGFDAALGRAAEWDLHLRLAAAAPHAGRITGVLCHRPAGAPGACPDPAGADAAAFREALRRYWARQGCDAVVTTQARGSQRAIWPVASPPVVSIIVTGGGRPDRLRACLDGLRGRTAYERREVILVDSASTDPAMLSLLDEARSWPGMRVVPFLDPPNAAAERNAGARAAATGELLLFLDGGIEITDRGWLDELVRWAVQPGVGIVGARLDYPDGALQHAGIVLAPGLEGALFRGAERGAWGVFGSAETTRNYLAVAGVCQMVRREVFEQVGGFDETYRLIHSDIALCLQAREKGWRTVYTPFARLTYHQPACGAAAAADDRARLAADIRALGLVADPFFHPALSPDAPVPELRLAPEVTGEERVRAEIAELLAPYAISPPLNLFDDPAMRAVLGSGDAPLAGAAMPERIDDCWSAARFCIAVLCGDASLRAAFPRALSEGAQGAFARWLRQEGASRFQLSADALEALDAVLREPPGQQVRQACVVRAEVLARFPLGFTPAGRRGLLTWLFREGAAEYALKAEQIWWFALECAEDPARELLLTWHLMPAWQHLFPEAPSRFGRDRFARWLAAMFQPGAAWALPDAWPEMLSAAQQLRLAWQLRPGWQQRFPDAIEREDGARAYLAWLGAEQGGLPAELRAWCRGLDLDATAAALAAPGVNVIGHFAYPSGLRTSVEALVEGLRETGVQVSRRDVPVVTAENDPIHARFIGLEEFPVTLLHIQPEPFFLRAFAMAGLHPRTPSSYRIGYWYWEMSTVPASWDLATLAVDELWVATRFVADALRERYDVPVHILPPGVELALFAPQPRSRFGVPEDRFAFLFAFHMMSIMERKNPLGLIRAFSRAFRRDEPVVLVLKTTFGENHPELMGELRRAAAGATAEVMVIDEIYTQGETLALMQACDAYISLHRSEGLGLTMAEAMLLGKPVIATGYSGNTDFMNEENSLLVDYSVVPIGRSVPPYEADMRWAAPSEEHAAALMRRLYDDRAFGPALGARAQQDLRRTLGTAAAGRRMAERLATLREDRLARAGYRSA